MPRVVCYIHTLAVDNQRADAATHRNARYLRGRSVRRDSIAEMNGVLHGGMLYNPTRESYCSAK